MDHVRILNKIRERTNLERAFQYALFDRLRNDHYYDCFEIDFVSKNRTIVLDELEEELQDIDSYTPRSAYAFYPPKSDLCYRRMIYIPFKDLVSRYAFAIVLSELLDSGLLPHCFANRKARGDQAKESLLEDFSKESWPRFCEWQKVCLNDNSVLLRTDISAFYDSVSHEYLANMIAGELSVGAGTHLIRLLKKMLRIPVISYSHVSGRVEGAYPIMQGLAIGNSTEGFLANLFLKNVDDAMQRNDIDYGRYNDDIRLFGKNSRSVQDAVQIIQELLLAKGLNLNAAKTELAESKEQMEELRSKTYQVSEYNIQEDEPPRESKGIEEKIDRGFDEFDRVFKSGDQLSDNKDAKDFCKFLSGENKDGESLLPLSERNPEHIEQLEEILKRWKGSTRHASWLIVQSAFGQLLPEATKRRAREILLSSLANEDINSYAKYRLLHHLLKLRISSGGPEFRFLDQLSSPERDELGKLIPKVISQPAFELNMIGLYALWILGASVTDIENHVQEYIPKPLGDPIKNALSYISGQPHVSGAPGVATVEEPDNQPAPY